MRRRVQYQILGITLYELSKEHDLTDQPQTIRAVWHGNLNHGITLTVSRAGIVCPCCGATVSDLLPYQAGRGLLCPICTGRVDKVIDPFVLVTARADQSEDGDS